MGWAAAGKIGLGLASLLFGGLGGKGKSKQDQTQSSEQSFSQQQDTQSSTDSEFNTNQGQAFNTSPDEDPLSKLFRYGLYDLFGSEYKKANKPVYGDAQKAGFLNDLNDLSRSSMEALKSSLGAMGAGDSGRFAQGASDIERGRAGKYTDFLSQLPFMEEQLRSQRVAPLLGFGTQLAGIAPYGQSGVSSGFNTGTQNSNTNSSSTSSGTSKNNSTGQQTQQGPGFWPGFFGNLGGLGGYASGQFIDQYFGKPKVGGGGK